MLRFALYSLVFVPACVGLALFAAQDRGYEWWKALPGGIVTGILLAALWRYHDRDAREARKYKPHREGWAERDARDEPEDGSPDDRIRRQR